MQTVLGIKKAPFPVGGSKAQGIKPHIGNETFLKIKYHNKARMSNKKSCNGAGFVSEEDGWCEQKDIRGIG